MAGNPRWLLLLSVAICYCSLFAESQAAATWKSGPAGQKAKFQPAKSGLTSGNLFGKLLSKATSHRFASMHEKLSLLSAKTAASCCANLVFASGWNESPALGSYSFTDNDENGNPVYLHESGSFVLFNPDREAWLIIDKDLTPIAAESDRTKCAEDNVGGWGWYDPDNESFEMDTGAQFTCK